MGYFTNQSRIDSKAFYLPVLEEYERVIGMEVFKAVLQDTSIANALLIENLTNITLNAEKFFKYGESTFTNGLPEGTVFFDEPGESHIAV